MKRWLRRILYAVLILVVLTIVTVQVVFWTDYPRRLVLRLVQQQLGLRVEAQGLSTGWFGNTTLRDVRLSLPLADESFLDMPTMDVQHTAFLPLVLTRNLDLRGIELNKPNLVVRRNNLGRWNLQDVAELIAKATAGRPDPGTPRRPPKLPRLRVSDATVAIIDDLNNGKALIEPLTARGDPDGPLVYRYHVSVPDKLVLSGQVAPGENYRHEASFAIRPPSDWLEPWVDDPPQPLRIDGKWRGVVVNEEAIAGRLELIEAQVANFGASGRVGIQTSGEVTIISPQNLVITTSINALPKVEIASGTVQVRGDEVTLQQVRLGAVGGLAQLDGSADIAARTADINGIWQDIISPGAIAHSGSLRLSIENVFPSRPSVAATINTRGRLEQGQWDGQITLQGAGRSWTEMDWLARVPRITWRGRYPLELQDISARVAHRGQMITLTDVQFPAADQIVSRGQYNLRDRNWLLRVRGGSTIGRTLYAPASVPPRAPIDFNLDAFGNLERAHLNELFLRARGIELRASGDYVYGEPEPVAASVYLAHTPGDVILEEELPIRGKLRSEVHVSGTLDPVNLGVKGIVRSEDLVIYNRPFGDIRGAVTAKVEPKVMSFGVQDLMLFGGRWSVAGTWPYDQKDRMAEGDVARIELAVQDLSLHDLGELAGTRALEGAASGKWNIDADVTRLRRDLIAASGSFEARDVAAAEFEADSVTGQMTVRNGIVRIDPVELRQGEGVTTVTIETTLKEPTKPTLIFHARDWPVDIGAGSAQVTAEGTLHIDAESQSATGPLKARATFSTAQQSIGEATIDGRLDGRAAIIDAIKLSGFGGSGEGRATIDAAAPNMSNAILGWNGLDGELIGQMVPALRGLEGKFSGALTLDPSTSERALEPLRLRLQLNSDGGRFRSVEIGAAKLSAFFNLGENFIWQRVVLDKLPAEATREAQREAEFDERGVPLAQRPLAWNDIRIADGRVRVWGRRGQHPAGQVQTHVIIDFAQLDLNQLVHAVKLDADPMPGRIHGQLIAHGDPQDLDAVIGDGNVRITNSDLIELDILKTLYNAMSLGMQPREPNGEGSLDLSLQRSTLTLNRVRYFNRGAEAWSNNLAIDNVWNAPDSPISGYVVGTAKPLSGLRLPLLADVDQIMGVLQSNLTTVEVRGTVADPEPRIATFNEVGGGLRQFLSGEVTQSRR